MLPDADLVFGEVRTPPPNHWCSSGHSAPEEFAREGPGTEKTPTRFFTVSQRDKIKVNGKRKWVTLGVYCEPCVIVANAMARK